MLAAVPWWVRGQMIRLGFECLNGRPLLSSRVGARVLKKDSRGDVDAPRAPVLPRVGARPLFARRHPQAVPGDHRPQAGRAGALWDGEASLGAPFDHRRMVITL